MEDVEVKIPPMKPEAFPPIRKRDLFLLLFKESFNAALKIQKILEAYRDPLPRTHPPLWLRIYKILKAQRIESQ